MTYKVLWCIDMDDTLFTSYGYVTQIHPDGTRTKIHYDVWAKRPPNTDHLYDFSSFRDEKAFIDTAKPIGNNWQTILNLGAKDANARRIIVTARQNFNNQMYFVYHLKHKLDDDSLAIYCVGDEPFDTAADCKYHVINRLITNSDYSAVVMVDDSMHNLETFLNLKRQHKDKMFTTYFVDNEKISLHAVR